jgi:hypothetical protein
MAIQKGELPRLLDCYQQSAIQVSEETHVQPIPSRKKMPRSALSQQHPYRETLLFGGT